MAYEDSLKYYRDVKNVIDTAKSEAKEEGIEEGREDGKRINQLENAKNALLKNLLIKDVSEITGLSLEETQEIAKSINSNSD